MSQKKKTIVVTNAAQISDGVDRILSSISQKKSTKSRFLNDIAAAVTDGKSTWASLIHDQSPNRTRVAHRDHALLDPAFEKEILKGRLGITIIGCSDSPMEAPILEQFRAMTGLADDGSKSYVGAIVPFDPFGAAPTSTGTVLSMAVDSDNEDDISCLITSPDNQREERIISHLNSDTAPTPLAKDFYAVAGVMSSCLAEGPTAATQMAIVDGSLTFVLGASASRNFGNVVIMVDGSGVVDLPQLEERAVLPLAVLRATGLLGDEDEEAALRFAWMDEIDEDLMARAKNRGVIDDIMKEAEIAPPGPKAPRSERRKFAAKMKKIRAKHHAQKA